MPKKLKSYKNKMVPWQIVTVEKAKDFTTIDTVHGKAVIEPGNYIATDQNGEMFGIPAVDFEQLYQEVL